MPEILNPTGTITVMDWSKCRVLVNKLILNRVISVQTVRAADFSAGKATVKVMDFDRAAYNGMSTGDELEVYMSTTSVTNSGSKVWGGYIVDKSFISEISRLLVITAKEYSQKLIDLVTPETLTANQNSFSAVEPGTIIIALMDNYQSEFTTDNVLTGTGKTITADFKGKSLFDCIKIICDAFDYVFYIDLNKDLHVQLRSTVVAAPVSDAITWGTNVLSLMVSKNKEFLVNNLTVYGPDKSISGSATNAASITANGERRVAMVKPVLTVAASCQSYADSYVATYKDPIQVIESKTEMLIFSEPFQFISVVSEPHGLNGPYQIREITQTYDKRGIYTKMILSQKILDLSLMIGQLGTQAQTTQLQTINPFTNVPIGVILAWAKTLGGVPALPDGWVQCDGQTLADTASLLNGQVIPNLNGVPRFLRGASTSGATGGADTHTLSIAEMPAHTHFIGGNVSTAGNNFLSLTGKKENVHGRFTETTGGGCAHENRPAYYSVVWVMRVR